jgi:ClpP class serine protease
VWTGKQAETHKLVDELGDFQVALDLACREADLPTDGTVRTTVLSSPRARLTAQPLQSVSDLLGLTTVDQLRSVTVAAVRGDWQALIGCERFWLIADGLPEI